MRNVPEGIDQVDRRILLALLEDGRLGNNSLAEKIGLSASACWQRVRRLEKQGFISAYSAILDQAKLGVPETVLVEVMLERHDDDALEEFGQAMARIPEVLEVYLTTGDSDYFIKVAVAGTSGYEEFLRNRLYKIKGVRHSRSIFTLRCLKRVHSVLP